MSAPAATSGPIERAGGVSAARLQLVLSRGLNAPEGRKGCTARRYAAVALAPTSSTRWIEQCWARRGLFAAQLMATNLVSSVH